MRSPLGPRGNALVAQATAGLLGFAWFIRWAGWAPLDPTNLSWLLSGDDWTPHLLGWLFFRNESLRLPLGRIDGLVYPLGTYLGFSDSNPWVSLLLRPFSALLPQAFQFIGPWLALCAVLQGVLGARLSAKLGARPVQQALAGALFATSPMLVTRSGHDALCAQWILVALIGLNLGAAPTPRAAQRAVWWALGLIVLSAGVHPYLTAMSLPLALALIWRFVFVDKVARWPAGLGASAIVVLAAVGTFALFGYFSVPPSEGAGGFGWFTTDLLTLVNPRGQSRWLPTLPASRPHTEGWGFLGAGVLLLVPFVIVSLAARFREARALPWRRTVPLLVAALLTAVYAMGNTIDFGTTTLVDLSALYKPFSVITQPFRGSGRFIWVAHYVAIAGVVGLSIRLWRGQPWVATIALLAALVLHAADFDWKGPGVFRRRVVSPLQSAVWEGAGNDYRHVALVPPQIVYAGPPCEGDLRPGNAWVFFSYLAARERMTINSGYLARYDLPRLHAACAETTAAAVRGELSPDTLYVVSPSVLRQLRATNSQAACGIVDGFNVCVSSERNTAMSRALAGGGR